MSQTFWHVRNCSLFSRLNEEQLQGIERRSRTKKFPKGSSIYLPHDVSDGAFLLVDGRVRICSCTPEGKQSILAFVEPGELFGELSLVESGEREERAEVIASANVVLIPADHLRELMSQSADLTLGVTKLIGLRRKRIERRLRSLLFRSNRDRLTHLLLELTDQYGNPTTEGVELRIRLSHQDLASIIGATRETVTTLLGDMQNEGLLLIRRQRLLLLDVPRLAGHEAADINASMHSDPADHPRGPRSGGSHLQGNAPDSGPTMRMESSVRDSLNSRPIVPRLGGMH